MINTGDTAWVLISTALVSFLMIPHYGLYGAAVALIVSALIQAVGSGLILKRELGRS